MPRGIFFASARRTAGIFMAVLLLAVCGLVSAQEIIDRVAARVENDIILLSDVQQLGRYQQLVEGKSEDEAKLLDRLIDQWVVQNEADASRFPHPSDAEIERELERLKKSFASPQAYEERKKQSGLSDAEIRDKVDHATVLDELSGLTVSSFGASGRQSHRGFLQNGGVAASQSARAGSALAGRVSRDDSRSAGAAKHRYAGRPVAERQPLANSRADSD